jgi:hypothetical protein
MHIELSNPAPFLILPQIPVVLFSLWLIWSMRRGILVTMPGSERLPIGKRIKIQSVGGPPPEGLVNGRMYIVVWSRPGKFRLKMERK